MELLNLNFEAHYLSEVLGVSIDEVKANSPKWADACMEVIEKPEEYFYIGTEGEEKDRLCMRKGKVLQRILRDVNTLPLQLVVISLCDSLMDQIFHMKKAENLKKGLAEVLKTAAERI